MIVITAPTSMIGRQVLNRVLESGKPVRVIARDPARLDSSMRHRLDLVQGSHGDRRVVMRAFKEADCVFWLVPPNPQAVSLESAYLDFTRPACEEFGKQAQLRVVGISALGHGSEWAKTAGLVTASLAMDDMIAGTGVNYRALTMPFFMDNLLRQVASIKSQGMFFGPIAGGLRSPTCATRDIAAVAARLLLDTSWSGQDRVPVLGPEDLSFDDMARILSDVLGKPVRYQQIPFGAFRARLIANGISEPVAQGYVEMMEAKNNGIDNAQPRTPEGSSPTSFRQWCEEVLKPAVERT